MCSSPATSGVPQDELRAGSRRERLGRQLPPDGGKRLEDEVELAADRIHLLRRALESASLRGVLELAASPGERVGAERRGVRLQRMGGSPDLLRVTFVETGTGGSNQPRGIGEELLDQLRDEP